MVIREVGYIRALKTQAQQVVRPSSRSSRYQRAVLVKATSSRDFLPEEEARPGRREWLLSNPTSTCLVIRSLAVTIHQLGSFVLGLRVIAIRVGLGDDQKTR